MFALTTYFYQGGDYADDAHILHAISGEKYDVNANVIPIWGTLDIFNTEEAARRSICTDE